MAQQSSDNQGFTKQQKKELFEIVQAATEPSFTAIQEDFHRIYDRFDAAEKEASDFRKEVKEDQEHTQGQLTSIQNKQDQGQYVLDTHDKTLTLLKAKRRIR